jgi:hypothetical protein
MLQQMARLLIFTLTSYYLKRQNAAYELLRSSVINLSIGSRFLSVTVKRKFTSAKRRRFFNKTKITIILALIYLSLIKSKLFFT